MDKKTNACEVCGIRIEHNRTMCDTCSSFLKNIEKSNELELVYLRKQLEKIKKQNIQIAKERDILVHRILQLHHPYCPQSLGATTHIPKNHPELIPHCESMGSCHVCWYTWVKKEAAECKDRICIQCQHKCTVNQKIL